MNAKVVISSKKTHSIERRHPWIFSGAIVSSCESLTNGAVVRVEDQQGNLLGTGHFQHATIAVRMLTFEDEPIDVAFYTKRIGNALTVRENCRLIREDNTIFRLVHGEGDGLPGLVIDFYNGVCVVQCHSYGMYLALPQISEALQHVLGNSCNAIYSKSTDTLTNKEGINDGYLFGNAEVPHVAIENGVTYAIDWVNGQKTGFFIDQRENRALLGKYAQGKNVLNTFCYSGGFSLACLQNGATHVDSLDSSKKAIELTEQNVALNNWSTNHNSIVADAIHYLKDLNESYDIIVLDPPAFAKHREKRHQAIQGYKRLNFNAIRQIKSGGLIFTFSCSQVVDKQLFTNTVIAAAIESGRNIRILAQLHQPADHPISAFHPEGEYLKGLIIQVD